MRTDPERARELLLEFADFTRYSFRRHGDFTTLAEELRSIEQYLLLEQARFGERLRVVLRIAPEVLPVQIPFLSLQPLVENAVKHGLAGREEGGTITVVASDLDRECEITIEDDGVGEDPETGAPRARPATSRTRSGWPTSTSGCGTRSATSTAWSSRPPSAPARGSSSACPSTPRGCTRDRAAGRPLRVLVIDDERPALDELAFLLERDPRVRRRAHRATRPPTRCACCTTCRWTPSSSTSRCRACPGSSSPRCWPGSARRRRWSS